MGRSNTRIALLLLVAVGALLMVVAMAVVFWPAGLMMLGAFMVTVGLRWEYKDDTETDVY